MKNDTQDYASIDPNDRWAVGCRNEWTDTQAASCFRSGSRVPPFRFVA